MENFKIKICKIENIKMMIQRMFLFILTLALFSCSNDELPEFNKIEKLRLIALTTATPEVSPGDSVTITPVVSDLGTSSLKDTVRLCVDLGIAYGVAPNCDNNPTTTDLHTLRNLILPGIGDNWTGSADSFTFNVPIDTVIFANQTDAQKYNGVNYLVEYTLENSSGEKIQSFKRIVVSESAKTTKNLNPVVSDIFSEGVSMTTLPVGQKVNLSTNVSSASAEAYQLKNSTGILTDRTEVITVTWMITDGKTQYYRSEIGQVNQYTAPDASPTGRSAYVFAVVRDDRGGVTVVRKKL